MRPQVVFISCSILEASALDNGDVSAPVRAGRNEGLEGSLGARVRRVGDWTIDGKPIDDMESSVVLELDAVGGDDDNEEVVREPSRFRVLVKRLGESSLRWSSNVVVLDLTRRLFVSTGLSSSVE
jgi:hypothetical protein